MRYTLRSDGRNLAVLFLLAVVLFGFGLGSFGLLDPDEPFYSLTAKEMLASHDWSTPVLFGQPQFEKPILYYWTLCASFKLFGVTEFAARLGSALAGTATVLLTYLWAVVLFRRRDVALLSAVILATASEFLVVSKIVLTDIFLCLFVTATLYCFSLGYSDPAVRKRAWFAVFVAGALGFLTKGPIALILPWMGIVTFLVAVGEAKRLREFPWVAGIAVFLTVGLGWYLAMAVQHGTGFVQHFFMHENIRRFFIAEHKTFDKVLFYPGGLLLGFFPWSAFLIGAILYAFRQALRSWGGRDRKAFILLVSSLALPFVFLTFAKSKLLSYILPLYPVTALVMGVWMLRGYRALRAGARPTTPLQIACLFFLGLFPPLLVGGCAFYDASKHLGILTPVLWTGIALVPLSWASLFLAWRRRFELAFCSALAAITVSVCVIFGWLLPGAQAAFSSKGQAAVFHTDVPEARQNFILANKILVRGICYYTGDPNVGVLTADPQHTFYSKHPIPMISTTEDLLRIDKKLYPVYCFMKPKDLKLLRQIADQRFSISILQSSESKTLIKLERADIPLSK